MGNGRCSRGFALGVGVSVPITDDEKLDVRTILSAFYHF
jgi:hypothetical protein